MSENVKFYHFSTDQSAETTSLNDGDVAFNSESKYIETHGIKYGQLLWNEVEESPIPTNGLVARYSARGKSNSDSDRDVLIDLTGNGHDITLNNFGWSGMSGYGGYSQNFNNWGYGNLSTMTQEHSSDKVELNVTTARENIYSPLYEVGYTFDFSIKVTGLQSPCIITVTKGSSSGDILTITQDGTYDINATIEDSWDQKRIYFFINNRTGSLFSMTIELVPEYPGALVADGVDDYGICTNFPILTKESGYTVIARRAWLSHTTETNDLKALVSNCQTWFSNGAFIFEYENNTRYAVSFGGITAVEQPELISYQTSSSYNGTSISVGSFLGTNELCLFRSIASRSISSSIALYDLFIYNRDLTEEEITQVTDFIQSQI